MFLSPPPKNNALLLYPAVGIGALFLTFCLFLLMAYLVRPDGVVPASPAQYSTIEMIRLIREETRMQERERLPEEPRPEPEQPPMPKVLPNPVSKPQMDLPLMDMATTPAPITPSSPFLGEFRADQQATIATGVIPLVRVEPRYPRSAAKRGTQGWVNLEFTIMEDGTVADVKVIGSEPGNVFDREAIRAILRWKFQPKVADGKAVKQRAQQMIEFKLQQ